MIPLYIYMFEIKEKCLRTLILRDILVTVGTYLEYRWGVQCCGVILSIVGKLSTMRGYLEYRGGGGVS